MTITDYEEQFQYQHLTVMPYGNFIVADYYNIELTGMKIRDKKQLDSPINMYEIKFCKWHNNNLLIVCEEFLNWSNSIKFELNGNTSEITIK